MKTIKRHHILFLLVAFLLQGCMPDSFTKFEEDSSTENTEESAGTSPEVPGSDTPSCVARASLAECQAPADVSYADTSISLDGNSSNATIQPLIIGGFEGADTGNTNDFMSYSFYGAAPPLGMTINPTTGVITASLVTYFSGTISVKALHRGTDTSFISSFQLDASRSFTGIKYNFPVDDEAAKITPDLNNFQTLLIVTLKDDAEFDQFEIGHYLTTEGGTKTRVIYKDNVAKQLFLYLTEAGPVSVNENIDRNPFYISSKTSLASVVFAINKRDPSVGTDLAVVDLTLNVSPSTLEMSEVRTLSFIADPFVGATNGIADEFEVCVAPTCSDVLFGALQISTDSTDVDQLDRTVNVQATSLAGEKLSTFVTYRVLPFAAIKSVTKAAYTQRIGQKLIIDVGAPETAALFTTDGYVSNEDGAVACVDFINDSNLYVTVIGKDGSCASYGSAAIESYFLPGDKLDNKLLYSFSKAEISEAEGTSNITYIFPTGAPDYDSAVPAPTNSFRMIASVLDPETSSKVQGLFNSGTLESNQLTVTMSPDPATIDSNLRYYQKSFCDDGDRIQEVGEDLIKEADCTGNWISAGSIWLISTMATIQNNLSPQTFSVNVKDGLNRSFDFAFKLSFDEPPRDLSYNRFILLPVTSTDAFKVGDYISSGAPVGSNIDCRSSELSLSLANYGGRFTGLAGADALIEDENFWNCAVGIVQDVISSGNNYTSLTGDYVAVKVIKGRFQDGMSLDNARIFSSEKSKIKDDNANSVEVYPYTLSLVFNTTSGIDDGDYVDDLITGASGKVVRQFSSDDGGPNHRIKAFVQSTNNRATCSSETSSDFSLSTCHFRVGTNSVAIRDTLDGLAKSTKSLEFIEAESLRVQVASGNTFKVGEDITADPDTGVFNWGNYNIQPLNGVVVNSSDSSIVDIMVRSGTVRSTGNLKDVNPYDGSKYYFDDTEDLSTGRTNDPVDDPSLATQGNASLFGDDTSVATTASTIQSSYTIYLYKDDPVSIQPAIIDAGSSVYTISPSLPEGLHLDSSTGEIRGAPKGKSDAQKYAITATNPFGSITNYLKIEVLEYFGVELFAQNGSEPFSYILHREGDANEITPCRVLKKQIDMFENDPRALKKVKDITCFLEAGERDLHQKGFNLAVRIPNNTCEYVTHDPYQFWAFKPGKSSSLYIQNVSGNSTLAIDGLNFQNVWDLHSTYPIVNDPTTPEDNNVFDTVEAGLLHFRNIGANNTIDDNQRTGVVKLHDSITDFNFDVDRYEDVSGELIRNIFGDMNTYLGEPTSTASAKDFLCSYNYNNEDAERYGPNCDEGSFTRVDYEVGVHGGYCFHPSLGRFDHPLATNATYAMNVHNDQSLQDFCYRSELGDAGLTCEPQDPDDADADTCGDYTTLAECVADVEETGANPTVGVRGGCKVCNGDANCISEDADATLDPRPIADGGNGDILNAGRFVELSKIFQVPIYYTYKRATQQPVVTNCGGDQNACLSGPAAESDQITKLADGKLLSEIYTVTKNDGVDTLGTEFEYSPSKEAKIGRNQDLSSLLQREVNSNIYLANYINDGDGNFYTQQGILGFFDTTGGKRSDASQYDLDAFLIGHAGYYGSPNRNDDLNVTDFYKYSRPYYGYSCHDSADNVVARVRLVVREWNTSFKPSDRIDRVSPDLPETDPDLYSSTACDIDDSPTESGVCRQNVAGFEEDDIQPSTLMKMDTNFRTLFDPLSTYNDLSDWDDFGFINVGNINTPRNGANPDITRIPAGAQACIGHCLDRDFDGVCDGSCSVDDGDGICDANDGGDTIMTTLPCWQRTSADCISTINVQDDSCTLQVFPAYDY
ncbi:MAG: Ig domain-containing protein [Bacteriovoracaceae bacterium]